MKQFSILFAFIFIVSGLVAQTKTATLKVWGNCGMCKTTIEGAAKNSGATTANWDTKSKILTVGYKPSKTSEDKILKAIAEAGYDNEVYTAPEGVYNNLHSCCKYDRKAATTASLEKEACCMKEGKCEGGKDCCKQAAGKGDCCAKGTCSKEGGCCASCSMKEGGKCCGKAGVAAGNHDGKSDCCKKEGKATCDMKSDCCKEGSCKHTSTGTTACKEKGCCKS